MATKQQQLNALVAQYINAGNQLAGALTEVNSIKARIDYVQELLNKLNLTLASSHSSLKTANTGITSTKYALQKNQVTASTAANNMSHYKSSQTTSMSNIQSITNSIADNTALVKQLQKTITGKNANVAKLRTKLLYLDHQIKGLGGSTPYVPALIAASY